MILRVYDEKKGREVTAGTIQKDIFIKRASSKHYMVKYQGYGISSKVIEKLCKLNVEHIIIKTATEEYTAPLELWLEEGTLDNFGHGEQIFYPVAKMKRLK